MKNRGIDSMQMQNKFFNFTLDLLYGHFNLIPKSALLPSLKGASLSVSFFSSRKVDAEITKMQQMPASRFANSRAHGRLQQFIVETLLFESRLLARVEFCLPQKHALFFWRVSLENRSTNPIGIDSIKLLNAAEKSGRQGVYFPGKRMKDLACYSNGWQSWSHSGVYAADEKARCTRLGLFQRIQNTNPSTPAFSEAGHFSSDFFTLIGDRRSRKGLIAGFLSQKQQFGILEAKLDDPVRLNIWADCDHVRLDPGALLITDWAALGCFEMDAVHPIDHYLDAVAREHELEENLGETPVGWCSWYQYYSKVTSGQISENLHALKKMRARLPLNKFQIDDGWQSQTGDWLSFRRTFPQGLSGLVKAIRQAGFQPGLWLAPFIVHPASRLRKEHPQWLLRTSHGRLAYAGFVWNTFNSALDLTNPQALQYAAKAVCTAAAKWNFPYLKLDFLYAAALKAKYRDDTKTRAQVLRHSLEVIKKAAGKRVTLLGCGAPLGSAIGIFPILRIGADVLDSWHPQYFGLKAIFRHEPHMPSARNSIQNILARAFLHRKWWVNDPDCLLVRPSSQLTLAEIQTLAAAIGMTGGSILLSDDLAALPAERIRLAASLLPPIGRRPWVLDWFDAHTPARLRLDLQNAEGGWHLLAFFHWSDSPERVLLNTRDFQLPKGRYWVRSFWSNELWSVGENEPLFSGELSAHGCLLLAVRLIKKNIPQYLGSDMHISQGKELRSWQILEKSLRFSLDLGRNCEGCLDLYLPRKPKSITCQDKPLEATPLAGNCIRLKVDLTPASQVEIKY